MRIGTEPILEAVPLLHVLLQVEGKGGGLVPLEEIPEDLQAGPGVQFPAYGGKLGKVGDEVGAHTGEIGAGFVDVPLRHRDGDVAVLHHAVVGSGHLGEQHFIVLFRGNGPARPPAWAAAGISQIPLCSTFRLLMVILAEAPESSAFSNSE